MKNEEGVNYLWKLTVSFKVVFVWIAVSGQMALKLLWRTSIALADVKIKQADSRNNALK